MGHGEQKSVRLLLEAPNIAVDARDDKGLTPLLHAVQWSASKAKVELLLQYPKIDAYIVNNSGHSALHHWGLTTQFRDRGGERPCGYVLSLILEALRSDAGRFESVVRTAHAQLTWLAISLSKSGIKIYGALRRKKLQSSIPALEQHEPWLVHETQGYESLQDSERKAFVAY